MQKATFQRKYMLQDLERYKIEIFSWSTSANSVFAVRYAHPNAFGISQSPRTLYDILQFRWNHLI